MPVVPLSFLARKSVPSDRSVKTPRGWFRTPPAARLAFAPPYRSRRPSSNEGSPSMADSVYRVTEVIGASSESWEAAARNAVETAATTVRDLRVAEVIRQDVTIENGSLISYRCGSGSRSNTRAATDGATDGMVGRCTSAAIADTPLTHKAAAGHVHRRHDVDLPDRRHERQPGLPGLQRTGGELGPGRDRRGAAVPYHGRRGRRLHRRAPTNPGCDGVTTPARTEQRRRGRRQPQRPVKTRRQHVFDEDLDDAPTVLVKGQPARTRRTSASSSRR